MLDVLSCCGRCLGCMRLQLLTSYGLELLHLLLHGGSKVPCTALRHDLVVQQRLSSDLMDSSRYNQAVLLTCLLQCTKYLRDCNWQPNRPWSNFGYSSSNSCKLRPADCSFAVCYTHQCHVRLSVCSVSSDVSPEGTTELLPDMGTVFLSQSM